MDYSKLIKRELEPIAPYVPGLREEQVREITEARLICKLSSNENPRGPFPAASEAMREAVSELNRYPDGACSDLVKALSVKYDIPNDQIVIGNGSNELLCLIGQAVLEPKDEIVYGWPSFIVYPFLAQVSRATAVEVPLTSDLTYDLEGIAAAITPKTKIVVLCNPNNPTGTIYTRKDFSAFMERVPEDVLVIVDEAYFEFTDDPAYPDSMDWFDGKRPLVVLRTFSKIYAMAGVRCGYGFMPQPLAVALSKLREPFNVNSIAQAGALASLGEEAEVSRRVAENATERSRIEDLFAELGLEYCPSQTNFVWVKVSDGKRVFGDLLKEGIIVRDFGESRYLRVGVGCPEDTNATIAAFKKLSSQGKL